MRSFLKSALLSLVAAMFWQPVLSLTVKGGPPPSPAIATPSSIERGGTVEAINLDKKTLTVDGQSYKLSPTLTTMHGLTDKGDEKLQTLKPGTKVRFSSKKNAYSGQEQVVEVWVNAPIRNAPGKR